MLSNKTQNSKDIKTLIYLSLCFSHPPSAWCAACGPCGPDAEPGTEQSPAVVSPCGPAGPLSPLGETPLVHPGPLDAGDAHT